MDLDVRRHAYASFVRDGRAPTVAETAAALGRDEDEVAAAYRELDEAHALVLHPGTTEIWMLNPFSTVETPHRVEAAGRSWYANCAWDALGIPGAFHAGGRIDSECADCGESVSLVVGEDGELREGADLLVHILVPAQRWWDDIAFT